MNRTNLLIIIVASVAISVLASTAMGFILFQVLKPKLEPPSKEMALVKEPSKPDASKTDLKGLLSSMDNLADRIKALESRERSPVANSKALKKPGADLAELREMAQPRQDEADKSDLDQDVNPELETLVLKVIERREEERQKEWAEFRKERMDQRQQVIKEQMQESFPERLEEMTEVLGLSWNQRSQVEETLSVFQGSILEQIKQIDWYSPIGRRSGMQKLREVREEYDETMQEILTPQQYKLYEEKNLGPGSQRWRRRGGALGTR